jgi:hypothetical protein
MSEYVITSLIVVSIIYIIMTGNFKVLKEELSKSFFEMIVTAQANAGLGAAAHSSGTRIHASRPISRRTI